MGNIEISTINAQKSPQTLIYKTHLLHRQGGEIYCKTNLHQKYGAQGYLLKSYVIGEGEVKLLEDSLESQVGHDEACES